ncbi:hypothetical protein K466DRAFT_388405 [Polyporus arcularius HHB13444]|uniref:Uncharacterized protein n=1 Tax=Polyporus arcularius HHB13444 TaxID=1314778 RepID=A0A5C3PWD8_9APHY|nr:hypothetical protein K466DRAFT_388405 [Polyporus arcularius HHB13444]
MLYTSCIVGFMMCAADIDMSSALPPFAPGRRWFPTVSPSIAAGDLPASLLSPSPAYMSSDVSVTVGGGEGRRNSSISNRRLSVLFSTCMPVQVCSVLPFSGGLLSSLTSRSPSSRLLVTACCFTRPYCAEAAGPIVVLLASSIPSTLSYGAAGIWKRELLERATGCRATLARHVASGRGAHKAAAQLLPSGMDTVRSSDQRRH